MQIGLHLKEKMNRDLALVITFWILFDVLLPSFFVFHLFYLSSSAAHLVSVFGFLLSIECSFLVDLVLTANQILFLGSLKPFVCGHMFVLSWSVLYHQLSKGSIDDLSFGIRHFKYSSKFLYLFIYYLYPCNIPKFIKWKEY